MDKKVKTPSKCCSTASVIDVLSKCFCIRAPSLKTATESQIRKIEAEISHDLYTKPKYYEDQTRVRESLARHKFSQRSVPRIPLKIRV